MSLIKKIRLYFYNKNINDLLKKTAPERKSMDLARAKSIGILFDANHIADREAVIGYAGKLERQGKKVHLLAYFKGKDEKKNLSFKYFNDQHIKISYIPDNQAIKAFTSQKFDILFGLLFNENLPMEYICLASKARFRIGLYTNKIYCFDLMVSVPPKTVEVNSFFAEVESILPKMNQRKYESSVI